MWPDIIGHRAEILADHARVARFFQHGVQIFLAFASVCFAIFRRRIITRCEMRCAAASLLEHLVPIERQKLPVFSRTPRKSINPVKTKHMIDPEKMETLPHTPDTLPQPVEVATAHRLPAKKRNTPVLPPFLRKRVVLEIRFRRRAAAPIERKFVRPRK